jgi:EAL domain-containing protein (putative c-di-GMP-specific phosphodiesterase class I)
MIDISERAWPLLLERVCRARAIEPAFQPIVDLTRGVVCGYEGLARIQEPEAAGGPQEGFAAAARHGLAARLEAAALEVMLAERPLLPDNCFLSINLSPEALMTDEVADVLAAEEDLTSLVLEITEQSPVQDYTALLKRLHRLRDRGAIVAVDDAGAGYASIRHLLVLRPEIVKIDRSLVAGIDHDPSRAAAVSALGAFAGVLDAWIVAEGVEHLSELERLIGLDVPMVQGYYVGRPNRDMSALAPGIAANVQRRQTQRRTDVLASLARPAVTVHVAPMIVAEPTVVLDGHNRPTHVLLPAGRRRVTRHLAMCVQATESLPDVALRAVARRSEDRFSPICLCDELGQLVGVIHVEAVLEQLATRERDA